MLRIERVRLAGGADSLRVEGKVAGPWVEELRQMAETCLATSPRLVLDLSGTVFVDKEGVRLLRRLKGSLVEIRGSSCFVTELLDGGKR